MRVLRAQRSTRQAPNSLSLGPQANREVGLEPSCPAAVETGVAPGPGAWEGFTVTAILAAQLLTLSEPLLGGPPGPSGRAQRWSEDSVGAWPWPLMGSTE